MKAEIQFFALPEDAESLLAFASKKVDNIVTDTDMKGNSHLIIGDCEIIYTPGTIQDDILIVGSVSINTGSVDDTCEEQERAKAVYRHLRKWIKKNYSNKLNTYMLEGPRNDAAARNHWISPAAKKWVKQNASRQLKLYSTSPIVFEVMVISKQMGEIKPVESNKVRGHG